jgi:hypothetical protein
VVIHPSRSANLVSEGCIALSHGDYSRLDQIIRNAKASGQDLALTVRRDGSAEIFDRNNPSIMGTVPAPQTASTAGMGTVLRGIDGEREGTGQREGYQAPTRDFRSGTFEQNSNEIMRYMINNFNLTPAQAAGVAGNLATETGNFRSIQEIGQTGGRGGLGLAQWTNSGGGRRRADFESYAARTGGSTASMRTNLDFLAHELRTSERRTIPALKKASTADEASAAFMRKFERPGTPHAGRRQAAARRALEIWQRSQRTMIASEGE